MPSPLSSCAVCGTPTTSRCSGCAIAGGPSIFFCSPEHQKLVWENHRLVCRDKSVRFLAPPLTQGEVDELRKLADQPYPEEQVDGSVRTRTLAGLLTDLGFNFQQLLLCLHYRPAHIDETQTQAMLSIVREGVSMVYDALGITFQTRLADCSPWQFTAWLLQGVFGLHGVDTYRGQLIRFQHHATILHALLKRRMSHSIEEVPDSWIFNSLAHLVDSLNDDISPSVLKQTAKLEPFMDVVAGPVITVIESPFTSVLRYTDRLILQCKRGVTPAAAAAAASP